MIRVLHVVPRWIGGGPERHLLELARQDILSGRRLQRTVLVLDRPVSAPLFVAARRVGLRLLTDPEPAVVCEAVAAADLVEVTVWNHPRLLDWLRQPWPAARVLMRSAVAGDTLPQILFPELVDYPDAWLLSAPPGYGSSLPAERHGRVRHIPSLADMSRLDGWRPRPHTGCRVGYLGGLTATKLHPAFADIVAGVEARFELYGDCDPETRERLLASLEQRRVAQRVRLNGHVEDLAEAYAEIDVFAYPLTPGSYATSEKALQEALWIGLPAVLIEGTAAVGWIQPDVTGLIARDIDDFVDRLNGLLQDPVWRRSLGAAAAEQARWQFDPARNATHIHALVEELLGWPKRERAPLSGSDASPEHRFLQALNLDRAALNERINAMDGRGLSSEAEILLRGEGGWLHYETVYGRLALP